MSFKLFEDWKIELQIPEWWDTHIYSTSDIYYFPHLNSLSLTNYSSFNSVPVTMSPSYDCIIFRPLETELA